MCLFTFSLAAALSPTTQECPTTAAKKKKEKKKKQKEEEEKSKGDYRLQKEKRRNKQKVSIRDLDPREVVGEGAQSVAALSNSQRK